jgi:hypothetical protein
MDTAIGIALGLGLAAAAGLRVFVPLLLAAIVRAGRRLAKGGCDVA